MKQSNKRAIFVSLAGNVGISVSKFGAALFTGSAAMFSEAIHSLVDTSHEVLLLLGVREAQAPADERHPYGQGKAIYFWGLIAVLFFTAGGAIAFYEGFQQTINPQPVEWSLAGLVVLGIAFLLDGWALVEALSQFMRTKGDAGFFDAMRNTRDPSMRILIFENSLDIAGESVALVGILLAQATGKLYFDGIAGMIVGAMLVVAALWQVAQIKKLLIGSSADVHVVKGIRSVAKSYPQIRDVEEISTLHMGPECIVVNLRARFVEATYAYEIEQVTHALERDIMNLFPLVKFVYVKAVSQSANSQIAHSQSLSSQNLSLPQGMQLLTQAELVSERSAMTPSPST